MPWSSQDRDLPVILKAEERMRQSLEPPYIQLLSQISKLPGGVKNIVDMRRDLLVCGGTPSVVHTVAWVRLMMCSYGQYVPDIFGSW